MVRKKGTCGCGRSPTGNCIGWHKLTKEEYQEKTEEEKEKIIKEAKEDDLKEMAKQWPEYTLEELKEEQAMADRAESFKEKDEKDKE